MSAPALVLFDDRVAGDWRPFTLTRPAGELLFGTRTLRGRAESALGLHCAGYVAAPHLADYDEPWGRPVVEPGTVRADAGVVYLSARFVAEPAAVPDHPALLVHEGRVVGCRIEPRAPPPGPDFFDDPDAAPPDLPRHELPGALLERVWEIMTGNPERVALDLAGAAPDGLPAHVHQVGDGAVSLGPDVLLHPGVVLDTRHGPIRLEAGVEVRPFTHLAGPAWVGPGSTLLGGVLDAVSVGPVCRVHGELEESVVLGYTNKAHDGFIGHAYVGMWVNLGALTTNSDLKNNYGPVRVWTPDGELDTGKRKVGSFIGDHVKTAIGTMLNTGTVVGAGSNIFGGMPPKYVPPFSWGGPDTPHEVDRFLATAEVVMGRRDVALSDRHRAMLRRAWRQSRS